MQSLIFLACIIGVAVCAPQNLYYELEYNPLVVPQAAVAAAAAAVPAAAAELEILLAAQQPAGAPARGFIKHEIPQPAGKESIEVLYPFGFAPAAPAVPAAPAAAVAPVVPVAPAVPVAPVAQAPLPKSDDEDDNDD